MAEQQTNTGYKRPLGYGLRVLKRKIHRVLLQPRVIHQERFIVVDESDRCQNPIFLIGCHRSGTTLLRQIVDSHPNIACPPETFFIEFLARATEHENYYIGLEHLGFTREQAAKAMSQYIGKHFDTYCKSKDKTRWADKSPTYTSCLPFIHEMFSPGAQYVAIYRHPFDIMNSLMSKGWRLAQEDQDPLANTAKYVAKSLRLIRDFQMQHADLCHEFRYERLMQTPEQALRDMFAFLGEPWSEQVMAFNEQKHDIGVGDPEAMLLKGFRPSINNWVDWPESTLETARQYLTEICEELGYETSAAKIKQASA